jgi:hypothetical protein
MRANSKMRGPMQKPEIDQWPSRFDQLFTRALGKRLQFPRFSMVFATGTAYACIANKTMTLGNFVN